MKFWKKSRVKRVRPVKLPRPEDVFPQPDKPASPVKTDELLSKLTPEARARLEVEAKKLQEIIAFTDEHPEDASTVIRAWLVQKNGK